MTKDEISSFNNLYGEPIAAEIKSHVLSLDYFKAAVGIKKATCSCGELIFSSNRAPGNLAGASYRESGIKEKWNRHMKELDDN